MTRKLEELLDIAEDAPFEAQYEIAEVPPAQHETYSEITIAEKIDKSLEYVDNINSHEHDMDLISKKALDAYEDLIALGANISDAHAGKIYEVASTMLKTAMEAKEAKLNRKLKMIDLQLKKLRIDKIDSVEGTNSNSAEFDRNELIAHISQAKNKPNTSDEGDK